MKGGVHAILGADSFLAEQALDRLLAATVGADRTEALQVLRAEETTWARVVDEARTPSLFVPHRALVVRGADALKGGEEEAAAYVKDPAPALTLILMAPKPDRRKGVWKAVLERASVVSAEPLKGRALRAHVAAELRRRRLDIGDEGLTELLDRVGQDLRRLMGEIDKLEAFGAGAALSARDVDAVLGKGLAGPLYLMGDAFAQRKTGDVLEMVEDLLDEGEAALRLLATLHRTLRQVRGIKDLGGARPDQIASRVGVPPFKVPELREAAGRWGDRDLKAALAALARADRGIKTGADPRVALTAAVVESCRRRQGEAKRLEANG